MSPIKSLSERLGPSGGSAGLSAAPLRGSVRRLILHGGAGNIPETRFPEVERGLRDALAAGEAKLSSALDAVEAAIASMESSGIYDAGLGSVLNLYGRAEMDALLMTDDGRVGGVIGLPRTENPIRVARAVMESSPHVLLSGRGAERFARALGFPPVKVRAPRRFQVYEELKARLVGKGTEAEGRPAYTPAWFEELRRLVEAHPELPHGTVGAVALDEKGRLVAGTSTGGITLKLEGRVSDSCLPGCGTHADRSLGVSCTGTGEVIVRHQLAQQVARRAEERGLALDRAARGAVRRLPRGTAGLIALDRKGHYAWAHNTRNLAVGLLPPKGEPVVRVARAPTLRGATDRSSW